jgi:membrane protease YdiL (CAAX protease family)
MGKDMLGKTNITNRIIWILLAFFGWYILMGEFFMMLFEKLLGMVFSDPSPGLAFVNEFYAPLFTSCLFFVLMCLLVKKNRFMIDVIRPTREGHSMSKLGLGILLGFLTNFFCILCALLHGDIKLYLGFSAAEIPLMIYAFICVFFQSTSEELWCRTFMYERLNVHYPLWVAIVINGTVFGLLHSFNPGITVLAMADLIICGLAYSLLRWYSGSIWTCFGIHTMWNFTQNFLFGLPNSGLVSEASVFHLDASTGISNLIYSYEFGVEGAVPAVFKDLVLAGVIFYLAKRDGRLHELFESRESRGEMPVQPAKETAAATVEFPVTEDSGSDM